MGFEGTGKKVLDAAMAEMDEDGSGEVDFEEFSAWFMKQDKDKQANIPPTPHFKGVMDDDGVDRRDEWASDDEEADEDLFIETQPLNKTTGSLDEMSPTRPGVRATVHKGHFDRIAVAKSFSTGDIDPRWKIPRTAEQKAATIYKVPELNKKHTTAGNLGALEEKLRAKHPTIAAAFSEFDEDRSGVVSKEEFRHTLYKLNIGMTKAQVDRVFAVFDANQDGVLDYSEFCEELAAKEPKNNMVYRDVMDGAQGGNPYRASAAENLLPKGAVDPIISHPAKPKMWYFWNSPCAASTVWRHMSATDSSSPYNITKDGRNPGSSLDFYERGTNWVKRHQDMDKKVVRDRQKERRARTHYHQEHCKQTYYKAKRREDEKAARRTATFRIQNQRYEGAVRRSEKYGANPVLTKHLSYDMGSDMHCPRQRNTHRDDMHTQSHNLYKTVMTSEGHSTVHNGPLEPEDPPLTQTMDNFATTSMISGF
jgi:Ca2+-binding EF-hand superfamily protein